MNIYKATNAIANKIKYQDSLLTWKFSIPIFGKPEFVDTVIERIDALTNRFRFEGFMRFNVNLYFFKFTWLTFYGIATKKYANKFREALNEIVNYNSEPQPVRIISRG